MPTNSLDEYRQHALKAIEQDKGKHRKHAKFKTWRTALAEGMLQIYTQIEHKRAVQAKWENNK